MRGKNENRGPSNSRNYVDQTRGRGLTTGRSRNGRDLTRRQHQSMQQQNLVAFRDAVSSAGDTERHSLPRKHRRSQIDDRRESACKMRTVNVFRDPPPPPPCALTHTSTNGLSTSIVRRRNVSTSQSSGSNKMNLRKSTSARSSQREDDLRPMKRGARIGPTNQGDVIILLQ